MSDSLIYAKTIKMSKKWANYLKATTEYKYNWAEGAYRSSKSVFNTLAFAMYLEKTPDLLHLVIASTAAAARIIVEDGDGKLGLQYYFGENYRRGKYKDLDAGFIDTNNGTKTIVYVGGSTVSSFEKFRGWSVGGVVMEEIDLLHENTLNEAKGRTMAAAEPKYFISHNPTDPKHSIYKWLEYLQKANKVNYIHSTIFDNPALSEKRVNDIISEYDKTSLFYQRFIMGLRVVAEGLIYNITDDCILTEKCKYYEKIICVCDPGSAGSATGMIVAGLRYDDGLKRKVIEILDEYYHRNDSNNDISKKRITDYVKDYADFVEQTALFYDRCPEIIVDTDRAFYDLLTDEFIQRGKAYTPRFPRKNGDIGKIENRIKVDIDLLFKKRLRFYYKCKKTIENFRIAQYDTKALTTKGQETRVDIPNADKAVDMIDCVEYAINECYNDLIG